MTDSNVLTKFNNRFDCAEIVKASIEWQNNEEKKAKVRIATLRVALNTGGLNKAERADKIAERDRLISYLRLHDPAIIKNEVFLRWIMDSELYDNSYSENENMSNNRRRINRLMSEEEEKFVLHSKGRKKVTFLLDRFEAAKFDVINLDSSNNQTVASRCDKAKDNLDECRDLYGLDKVMIERIKSPVRGMVINSRNSSSQHIQIMEVLGEHQVQLEDYQKELLQLPE